MISFIVFIFGLIIGSFLNVVILRYNTGKSLNGRSGCMSCGKKLNWYELVPVFSFLIQKRKCRGCKNKISWQYPIVEILTGLIFLAVYTNEFFSFEILNSLNIVYLWVVFSVLIVITVYDMEHKIIPDSLVFLFIGLSLVELIAPGFGNVSVLNLLAGPILAFPFAFLWFVSGGKWIGFGDAKLSLGIGWFLGLINGISAIVLAFWIGSLFGIFLILISKLKLSFLGKNFTIKSEIPFAPFLILGTILIYFFEWDILGLKLFL